MSADSRSKAHKAVLFNGVAIRCAKCRKWAVVGLGRPPVYLCLPHFEKSLEPIGQTIRTAIAEFKGK